MPRERLTQNFYRDEFECNCGCGVDQINQAFVEKLQVAREKTGISFIINRGASCEEHNRKVGGRVGSVHVPKAMPDGEAHGADINTESSRAKYIILFALAEAGFTRFGIYENFIHVDDADTIDVRVERLIF